MNTGCMPSHGKSSREFRHLQDCLTPMSTMFYILPYGFQDIVGRKKAQNSSQHKGTENQEEPKWLIATWLTFFKKKMCFDCVILSKKKDGKNKTGNASR